MGLVQCMSLKQPPKGNSHIHIVAAILRKDLFCIYLPLKMQVSPLSTEMHRCFKGSRKQPRTQAKVADRPDHTFIFIFQSIPAQQDKNFISPAETQKPTAN